MAIPSFTELRVTKCCCFDLRTGTLIIAGLNLLAFVSLIIRCIVEFFTIDKNTNDELYAINLKSIEVGIIVYTLLLSIFCVLLIRGVMRQVSYYMFPWLCINFSNLLFSIALSFAIVANSLMYGGFVGFIVYLMSTLVALAIEGYFYLVMFSYYCEVIDAENGNSRGV